MNSGYLSLLLFVVSLILFASGWKDWLMRGITSKGILLFFVLWLVGMNLVIVLPQGRIGLWVFVLVALIIGVVLHTGGMGYKLHMICTGVLLGAVSFFMLETIHLVPSMMWGSAELSMALVLGLLVNAMFKAPGVQLTVLSMALLLGEAYFRWAHKEHIALHFGSSALQDRWWLSVYTARGISLVLDGMIWVFQRSVYWVSWGLQKWTNNRE